MPDQRKIPKSDIELRKKALKEELEKIESELQENLSSLQSDVSDRSSPIWWIKKHPLRILGTAVLIGFLAGNKGSTGSSVAGTTITAAVIAALKTVAARKIVEQVVKMVEGEDNNSDHT